jgi:hypothetical protein
MIAQCPPYLKCIIPVFEDLLPKKHNNIVMDLLFELATWHALAKLQMHTGETLDMLSAAMKALTTTIRRFLQETCEAFTIKELRQEAAC